MDSIRVQLAETRLKMKIPQDMSRITGHEMYQATFRPNPRMAPGADGISFEMWRRLLPIRDGVVFRIGAYPFRQSPQHHRRHVDLEY